MGEVRPQLPRIDATWTVMPTRSPGAQPAGVPLPPVGARSAVVQEVRVNVDEHARLPPPPDSSRRARPDRSAPGAWIAAREHLVRVVDVSVRSVSSEISSSTHAIFIVDVVEVVDGRFAGHGPPCSASRPALRPAWQSSAGRRSPSSRAVAERPRRARRACASIAARRGPARRSCRPTRLKRSPARGARGGARPATRLVAILRGSTSPACPPRRVTTLGMPRCQGAQARRAAGRRPGRDAPAPRRRSSTSSVARAAASDDELGGERGGDPGAAHAAPSPRAPPPTAASGKPLAIALPMHDEVGPDAVALARRRRARAGRRS